MLEGSMLLAAAVPSVTNRIQLHKTLMEFVVQKRAKPEAVSDKHLLFNRGLHW